MFSSLRRFGLDNARREHARLTKHDVDVFLEGDASQDVGFESTPLR